MKKMLLMLGFLCFSSAHAVSLLERIQGQGIGVRSTTSSGGYVLQVQVPETGELVEVQLQAQPGPLRDVTVSYQGFSPDGGAYGVGVALGNIGVCMGESKAQGVAGAEFLVTSIDRATRNGEGTFRRAFGPYTYTVYAIHRVNGNVTVGVRVMAAPGTPVRCTR